jgi:hypothetical protein
MQDVFLAVADDGVACIAAACGTHDDVGIFGEEIDDLAFSFIAPLGADYDGIGHGFFGEGK